MAQMLRKSSILPVILFRPLHDIVFPPRHRVFAFANYMYNENGQNQFETDVTMFNSTNDLQNMYAAALASLGLGLTKSDVITGLNDDSAYGLIRSLRCFVDSPMGMRAYCILPYPVVSALMCL